MPETAIDSGGVRNNGNDLAEIIEQHASNGTSRVRLPNVDVSYSRPDGVYSSVLAVEELSGYGHGRGIVVEFSPDQNPKSLSGVRRIVKINMEDVLGRVAEFSSDIQIEDIPILIAFAKDPASNRDIAHILLELTEREKTVLERDREMLDRELDELREDNLVRI